MSGRKALYGAVGLLALTSACLAFEGEGGSEEAFCLYRPSICTDADPVERPDGGTATPKDGGTTFDGGNSWSFSPGKVGLIGTLSEGAGGLDVYCDIRSSTVSYGGIDGFGGARIHPTSGSLYYLYRNELAYELRRFTVDKVFRGKTSSYPQDWEKNDPVVPTPQCDAQEGIQAFHIRPDGAIVYRCRNSDVWFDATSGTAIDTCTSGGFAEPDVLAFSEDGASLCGGQVMDAEGVTHPVTGFNSSVDWIVARSRPGGGFWVAGRIYESDQFERWSIAADGTATQDGVYAVPPEGWLRVNADVPGWAMLDAEGNFYRWGFMEEAFSPDTIVEFSADFTSANIVYDESKTEVCKMHGSFMVPTP